MSDNNKSSHILSTSSNLLGICFFILTSLNALKIAHQTIVDEIVTLAIVIFMASSLLSFLSIRSKTPRGEQYEKIADTVFLCGLVLLFLTTITLAFKIIA